MTVLAVSAALALALRCAPAVDPSLMVGIGQAESGLEPLTLHDNRTSRVVRGAGAIEAARQLIAAGHSVDLGAWQINSRNLPMLRLGVADAFDPCRATAAVARLLALFSRYNTGSPTRGVANGYAAAVVAAIHQVRALPRRPLDPSPPPNPFTRPSRIGREVVFVPVERP